jgi:hypothetical protein
VGPARWLVCSSISFCRGHLFLQGPSLAIDGGCAGSHRVQQSGKQITYSLVTLCSFEAGSWCMHCLPDPVSRWNPRLNPTTSSNEHCARFYAQRTYLEKFYRAALPGDKESREQYSQGGRDLNNERQRVDPPTTLHVTFCAFTTTLNPCPRGQVGCRRVQPAAANHLSHGEPRQLTHRQDAVRPRKELPDVIR